MEGQPVRPGIPRGPPHWSHFPNRERLFHLCHCPCAHLVFHSLASSCSHLPPTLVPQPLCHELPPPLLSRPWKTPQPLRGMKLARRARMEGPGSDPSEVLSKTQGSPLQSGQVLRHFVGHRDSVQSSDFAPSSDCLVSHLCPGPNKMRQLGAHTLPTWARVVKIPHLDLALLSLSPLSWYLLPVGIAS